MTELTALWLPILVSAVFVFVVSSIIHMGPFWHRTDFPKAANEDKILDALRPIGMAPGEYMMPRATSTEEMKSQAYAEKLKKGPVLIMTVLPNRALNMTQNLMLWLIYCTVVGIFSAYVAGRALPADAHYLAVFRFAGTTAFLGYTLSLWQMWIWYKRSISLTIKSTVDGLIYALVTAGVFGWLWPR